MRVEVDQSGRVEDLTMNTVVGLSNDHTSSVFVSAGTKREIVKFLKSKISSSDYAPLFFSILIFFLLREEKLKTVLVDEEYTGKDEYISGIVKGFFENSKKHCPEIIFGRIGKHSRAHALVIGIHRTKGRGSVKINLSQVVKLFPKKVAGTSRHTHRVSR